MLFLTLIRHAKSSWDDLDCEDFDRPLSKRGFRDAPKMAAAASALGCRPQLILCSPSKRTLQTLNCFLETGAFQNATVAPTDAIYEASSGELIEIITSQSAEYQSLAVIGHNPGLTHLVEDLSGINLHNLPTSGIVMFNNEGNNWADIGHSDCKLLLFLTPKGVSNSHLK